MSNRTKIESFCKKNKVELVSCKLNKFSTVVPECRISITEYCVTINVDGKILRFESGSYSGDTTSEDVELMLESIKEEIEEIRYDPTTTQGQNTQSSTSAIACTLY